jgi:ATP-dependent exoDNAse (exonuclease V) alpha subunit
MLDIIKDPFEVQVLTPMKTGPLGTEKLNPVLRKVFLPDIQQRILEQIENLPDFYYDYIRDRLRLDKYTFISLVRTSISSSKNDLFGNDTMFVPGDKVIHTVNDYDITGISARGGLVEGLFNGEQGVVLAFHNEKMV